MSAQLTRSHGSALSRLFVFATPTTEDPAPCVFGTFAQISPTAELSTDPLALLEGLRACCFVETVRSPLVSAEGRLRTREGLRVMVWV